ncbi:MAG: penicillin acylase family protein [Candidatus Binatia bacterium]|nr:penicillin acylase family protein [Candidatus Binatia bacterium]
MNPGDRQPPRGPPRSGFGGAPWTDTTVATEEADEHADRRSPFGGSGWTGTPGLVSDSPEPETEEPKAKPTGRRRRSTGPTHTRRTLAALGSSADLLRDENGVPHVYAKSERDAYAALGFCMAEDRLWQMDFYRRIATGRSAELLGEQGIARRDALVRTVGIPRRAAAAASRMDGIARDILAAFAGGVNAARAIVKPAESERLGYEIEPWTIADSLAIELYLAWCCAAATWPEKLLVASALAHGGVERARIVSSRPVDFVPTNDERLALWRRIDPRLINLVNDAAVGVPSGFVAALRGARAGGVGALTAAIELPLMSPSPMYTAFLDCPAFRAVGIAHVGMPGLLAGRNEHVAWGVTGARIDDADCVMEELDGIGSFRSEAGWEKLSRRREIVRVRDGDTIKLEVAETRHGPLLSHLMDQLDGPAPAERPVALALCWGANSLGTAVPGLLAMARAKDGEDLLAAAPLLDRSPLPLDALGADGEGGAVKILGGAKPTRNSASALPLRGWISEARWSGAEPLSNRSAAVETDVALATGALGEGGNESVVALRAQRLAASLQNASGVGALDALSADVLDDGALALLPAIRAVLDQAAAAGTERVRAALVDWNGSADSASTGAAVFYVALAPYLVDALLPEARFGSVAQCREVSLGAVARVLGSPELSIEQRDGIVDAFRKAEQWLVDKLGSEPSGWRWGAVHTMRAEHPCPDPEQFPSPATAAGGSPFTILGQRFCGPRPPFQVDVAVCARLVVDLATKEARVVGVGTDVTVKIGDRPKTERVELICA